MISTPLAEANEEIQLAVELIHLLEVNQIPPQTVLAALAIVVHDYQKKVYYLTED